jgi:hypothetical protein
MAFDVGQASTNVTHTNTYEYFKVEVPPDALGWDIRLTNVTSGSPLLIVSRDALALNATTPGWNPALDDFWPSFGRWIAGKDWTQRTFAADGTTDEDGRILAMGMGRPLEPGTYYVGVYNESFPQPMSYTIVSRGIGGTNSIPVVDLPFTGGNVSVTNSPAARSGLLSRGDSARHTQLAGQTHPHRRRIPASHADQRRAERAKRTARPIPAS